MRTITKLGLTALTAALLLTAIVSTTSARSLSTSNTNIRASWRTFEFVSSAVTVRCPITIEGNFHSRTIAKVRDNLVGQVTRADINNPLCTGGRTAVARLPWHLTYQGFTGTLPRISVTQIAISRFRFIITVRLFGVEVECEVGNETDRIFTAASLNEAGEITSVAPIVGRNTATGVSGFPCPMSGSMIGPEGVATLLGTTTRIRITLI